MVSPQTTTPTDDAITWSAARKLDWSDFKAKPEGGALGGARSAISHTYAIGCRDQVLQMKVQSIFLPDQSWVSYRIMSSGLASRVGLRHEQIHFDLAEVYARRVRKLLRELRDPCSRSDAELNAMAEHVFTDHWTAQRRYEQETHAGELEPKQVEWDKRIAAELLALAAFAAG